MNPINLALLGDQARVLLGRSAKFVSFGHHDNDNPLRCIDVPRGTPDGDRLCEEFESAGAVVVYDIGNHDTDFTVLFIPNPFQQPSVSLA